MAKLFVFSGILLLLIGILLYFVPALFSWFGRLPGDIRVGNENVRVYIPLVSMLLLSVVITVLLRLGQWLFRPR